MSYTCTHSNAIQKLCSIVGIFIDCYKLHKLQVGTIDLQVPSIFGPVRSKKMRKTLVLPGLKIVRLIYVKLPS